jgi:hypothetical protein
LEADQELTTSRPQLSSSFYIFEIVLTFCHKLLPTYKSIFVARGSFHTSQIVLVSFHKLLPAGDLQVSLLAL